MFRAIKKLIYPDSPLDTKWAISISKDVLQTVFEYQETVDALNYAQACDQAKAAYIQKFGAKSPQYIAEDISQCAPEHKKSKKQKSQSTMQRLLTLYGKDSPALLSCRGVVENKGRIFNDITGFQYAILIDHKVMQRTLLKFLPRDAAEQQIEELKRDGFKYQLAPLADKKADAERQQTEASLKRDIDSLFDVADAIPLNKYDANIRALNLSVLLLASAQCVYRDGYTKTLQAMVAYLDYTSDASFKAYMMGRVLWAAKLINDTDTLNRYIPQLHKLLSASSMNDYTAFAWSYLAAVDVKNYKAIKPHMLAATDYLKKYYDFCSSYRTSKPDEAKPYIQDSLTNYIWSLLLNLVAGAQTDDYLIRSMVENSLENIAKSDHPVDALTNIPESQGQAWAIGVLRYYINRCGMSTIPLDMEEDYDRKFDDALSAATQSAKEKKLTAPALMGSLYLLKKEGVVLVKHTIPDLINEVNYSSDKALQEQPIKIFRHVPDLGYKYKIRNVYLQENNTLAVIAYFKDYGGGCMAFGDVGDKVKVKVEKTLPVKIHTVTNLKELEQKKAEFKNAKCIYSKKMKRTGFFPFIEIDPNAPREEKDEVPELPKIVKITRRAVVVGDCRG